MKKSTLKKDRTAKRAKLAVAAASAMMAVPMLGAPATANAQAGISTTTTMTGVSSTIKSPANLKWSDRVIKIAGTYSIAGVEDQQIVFRKAGGGYFFIDPESGDMKAVSPMVFDKWAPIKNSADLGAYLRKKLPGKMKSGQITVSRGAPTDPAGAQFSDDWLKDHREAGNVTILGVDDAGHDVLQTSSGQMVYLDPTTGDFVPVVSK
jgi:hypothetical protein